MTVTTNATPGMTAGEEVHTGPTDDGHEIGRMLLMSWGACLPSCPNVNLS